VLAGSLCRKPSILKADSNGELSGDYFRAGLAAAGVSPDNKLVRLFIAMRNAILRRASSFVALSSAMELEFRQEGVRSDKICRIPNGVDTRWFRPPRFSERDAARHELGFSSENFVLTYTGRLVTYKGLPSLLSVWKEASERHPHARLVIVGSGGSDIHNCEDWLKGYVADHGLVQSVQFMGSVGDVRPYLWASDGFVFPTEDEAFGISLIEAMACGLPCIATRVGGVIDVAAGADVAMAVQPAHRTQLLDAIDRLLVDANLAAELGKAAARMTRRAYSRDVVAERYDELISRLLGREEPVRSIQ
jgi:glycosyltransferase involved in cell wall biosynthesis